DISRMLGAMPAILRRALLGLERLYIPSVYFCVKLQAVSSTIGVRTPGGRRALLVTLAYAAAFGGLGVLSWASPVCLLAAGTVRVHCTRFIGAFQHTFDHVDHQAPGPRRNRSYEHQHTFSFPVAHRLRFLNRFILNFGFHGAHHTIPGCPWYNLPRLQDILST